MQGKEYRVQKRPHRSRGAVRVKDHDSAAPGGLVGVLENALGPQDESALGDEVVALGVDLAAVALDIEDGGALAAVFVEPGVDEGVVVGGELGEFFVGGAVEGVGELLGLDAGAVADLVAELLLDIALTGAGEGGDDPAVGDAGFLVGDELGGALAVVAEAHDVGGLHDPPFELVADVIDGTASLDAEELGVERATIEDQAVGLKID